MKQKITLIMLMLWSVLVFGQKHDIQPSKERHLSKLRNQESKFYNKTSKPAAFRVSEDIVKQRLDSIVLEFDWKGEYVYDQKGNLIEDIEYSWNSEMNKWENSWKEQYVYDKGNLTKRTQYQVDSINNKWQNSYNTEYVYDEKGNLMKETWTQWNLDIDEWENSWKYEYLYDIANNRVNKNAYDWDSDINEWGNDWREEYLYDEKGNFISKPEYKWNSEMNQWENSYNAEYVYDEKGNLIQEIGYNWDSEMNEWENSEQYDYTYDEQYTFEQLILPYEDEDDYLFNNMLTNVKSSDNSNEEENTKLYYSQQTITNVEKSIIEHGKVYPNPVSNIINIELLNNEPTALFELVDLQGRVLIFKQISTNEQVNVADLQSGYYIYTISVNDTKQSGKLIKQ